MLSSLDASAKNYQTLLYDEQSQYFLILFSVCVYGSDELIKSVQDDLRAHNEFSAKNGSAHAKARIKTEGTTKFTDWKEVAELGIPEGQILLGICNLYGIRTPENDVGAVKWMRKAAEQAHADGQYHLSIHYFYGVGVPEDKEESFKWIRKAAEQGHVRAQGNLGAHYFHGVGVSENKEEAAKWFRKAADKMMLMVRLTQVYAIQKESEF